MAPSPGMGAEMMPVAQKIAQAAAMGAITLPNDPQGWQSLLDEFQSGGGPIPGSTPAQPLSTPASATPITSAGGNQGDLNSFLSAIKQHESGGNYRAYNAGGGASGAYQFIQSTWASEANAAGYGQYANGPAGAAPPAVQDAVAAHMGQSYYDQYGDWNKAAQAWYMPADVGKNVVPDPQAGNTESVTDYGNQIVSLMGQQQKTPAWGGADPNASLGAPSAVSWALNQVGTPYVWGGEDPSAPGRPGAFDCSGLVQATFKAIGVNLPRVAQAQYDATTKIPPDQLQAGDLVFFGQNAQNISHVGIYIGNGKMVDAPHTGADVRVESYQWGDFVGATRPSDPTGQSIQQPVQSTQATQQPQQGNISAYYTNLSQVMDALSRMGASTGARP